MKKFLIVSIIIFTVFPVYAASFECGGDKSLLENLICSDSELSSLDSEVGDNYRNLKSLSDNNNEVLQEQRRFLKQRTIMCPLPTQEYVSDYDGTQITLCLKYVYKLRINDLKSQIATISDNNFTAHAKQEVQNIQTVAQPSQTAQIVNRQEPEVNLKPSMSGVSIDQNQTLVNSSVTSENTENLSPSQTVFEEKTAKEELAIKSEENGTEPPKESSEIIPSIGNIAHAGEAVDKNQIFNINLQYLLLI